MFQKLYIFLVLFVCMFSLTDAAFQKGTPYATLGECTSNKIKYDSQYSTYDRSNCYKDGGSYLYTLCGKGEGCADDSMSSGGPINTANSGGDVNDVVLAGEEQQYNIPDRYKKVLDLRLQQIGKKDLETLQEIESKISALIPKYRNSQLASDVLGYFLSKLHKIIEEKKIEAGSSDVDQLVCSLAGTCASKPPMIIDPVPPIVTPNSDSTWPITDPYGFGSNKTAGPFKNPDGQTVYIVDKGDGNTRAPSCMNGFSAQDCHTRGLFRYGATTNEVWSIRLKTKDNLNIKLSSSIYATQIGFGIEKLYLPGRFNYVLATKPGLMESDLKTKDGGKCFLSNTYGGKIKVFPSGYIGSYPGCIIPENTLLYMNVRAVSSECDTGKLCNSSIGFGSAFEAAGLTTAKPTSYEVRPRNNTQPAPTGGTQVRGECGDTLNTCRVGIFVDRADTDEGHVFSCEGEGIIPQWCTQSYATGEGEDGTDTTDNTWSIKDPYGFGSNKTAGPFKNPDGQTVYIIDEGNGITRAPSCVNGLGGNYCANQGLFFTGAKTDEIRSIRLKTKEGLSSKFTSTITASKIAFGIEDVYLPGKFDFVLATKPGLMKSDLVSNNEGESCSIRNNYSGSIKVFPKTYNGYYKNSGCTIPEGTLLYMNIRAVTAKCDEKGILCNSNIIMGSSFGSSRFHTPTTPPTPQPATPAPTGGTASCRLADGTTLAHGGNSAIYSLYRKNGCNISGTLACDNGRITSAGFSPNINDSPRDWYNTKSACQGISSDKNMSVALELKGITKYNYVIDYNNLSAIDISISRNSSILKPNIVSKRKILNLTSMSVGKCGAFFFHGGGKIIGKNKPASQWKDFNTYLSFCKTGAQSFSVKHRVKLKNAAGQYVFKTGEVNHGSFNLTTKKYTPSSDVTSSSVK